MSFITYKEAETMRTKRTLKFERDEATGEEFHRPGGEGKVKRTRTTVTLDDDLIHKAQTYTGVKGKSALIREALTQLVQREAARRLGALGGTMPDLQRIPRRKMPRKGLRATRPFDRHAE